MKKMNMIQKFVLAGVALMSFGQSSFMFGAGDNVNPLTGQAEANRSCFTKDKAGKCMMWKVLVDGKWMAEKVGAGESCSITVTLNDVHAESTCKGSTGTKCVCMTRVPL